MSAEPDLVASVHDAARRAFQAGLTVVPPVEDGSKRPQAVNGTWDQFKTERPTAELMRTWWPGRSGLGIVAGEVEPLDFDDPEVYAAFIETAQATGLGELADRIKDGYTDETPGGVRWLWRCPGVDRKPNEKLARRPKRDDEKRHENDNVKSLIELPDFGILAPSNGTVHPSGKAYVRRSGDFGSIATITIEERDTLLELARSFDEMPRNETRPSTAVPKENRNDGKRPGDDYNARTTWAEVLEPNGWTHTFDRGEVAYWRRPGKDRGISATTNFGGSDFFYPFSSSTEFEAERSYSKFAAYAVLSHAGDFKAAARRLGEAGYGDQRSALALVKSTPVPEFGGCPVCGRDSCEDPSHTTTALEPTVNGAIIAVPSPVGDFVSAATLAAEPPPVCVIEDAVYRGGVTVLAGESGAGKSFVPTVPRMVPGVVSWTRVGSSEPMSPAGKSLARPKSRIFTKPSSLIMMFSGFKSR